MPQRPVMIHLRETQVFKGQMPQPVERRVDIHCSRAYFFEEPAQLVLVHRKLQDSSAGVTRRGSPIPAKEVPPTHLNSLGLG